MIGSTTFDGFSMGRSGRAGRRTSSSGSRDLGLGLDNALEATFTVGLIGAIAVRRGHLQRGRRRHAAVGAPRGAVELARMLRAHARADRVRLCARALLLAAHLPGPGDRLPRVRPARQRVGPVRDRRTCRSTTTSSPRRASGTCRWRRSSLGHVAGLILAHDRALVVYDDVRDATRSQYWMLAVMVCFTSLGLWLLSAANG